MIKKEIYPKTKRVPCNGEKVYITEKLDGSNLVIFKKEDILYIAQRKYIFSFDELEANKDKLYKGLYDWLIQNKDSLMDLWNDSAICGEWLGMGKITYDVGDFGKRYYMFAKARVTDDFTLTDLQYNHDDFYWIFESKTIPICLGVVPEVVELSVLPNKEHLDSIYTKYCLKVNRIVEGFVLNYRNHISKYVRFKDGKLQEHHE